MCTANTSATDTVKPHNWHYHESNKIKTKVGGTAIHWPPFLAAFGIGSMAISYTLL